jgi:toxin CcdB
MAQYDVYPNPHPASRASVPYVVDVQSNLIEQLPTRLVMPLSRAGAAARRLPVNLCPMFEIDGEQLSLHAHQAAAVPAKLLRGRIATVAHRAPEISASLDAVLSGF